MNIEELKRLAEAATPGPWAHGVTWIEHLGGIVALGNTARSKQDVAYVAAANPAAVLELIAEVDRQRGYADDLTIALESSEKQLKDSRANDYTAMGYLADCRMAVGDNGKRMLPEFVEYLRQLKQQRDELLAALKDAGFILDKLRTASNGEQRRYAVSFARNTIHVAPILEAIKDAIAKAEG